MYVIQDGRCQGGTESGAGVGHLSSKQGSGEVDGLTGTGLALHARPPGPNGPFAATQNA